MTDWLGLLFFVLMIISAFVGLKILAKPQKRTEAEFERNAAENPTMLGASLNALHGILDPKEARAKIEINELKQGRYNKKRREGKASGEIDKDFEKETSEFEKNNLDKVQK